MFFLYMFKFFTWSLRISMVLVRLGTLRSASGRCGALRSAAERFGAFLSASERSRIRMSFSFCVASIWANHKDRILYRSAFFLWLFSCDICVPFWHVNCHFLRRHHSSRLVLDFVLRIQIVGMDFRTDLYLFLCWFLFRIRRRPTHRFILHRRCAMQCCVIM